MMLFHIVAGIFGSFGFHLENQPQEKPGGNLSTKPQNSLSKTLKALSSACFT
jgi:hypothetical protein